MKSVKKIMLSVSTVLLTSCGSFGEGMLAGLSNMGSIYGYGGSTSQAVGNSYVPSQTFNFQNLGTSGANIKFDFSHMESVVPSSGGCSGGTTSSGSNSGSSQRSYPSTTTPSHSKTCHICHGTKKCWTCGGKRTFINPLTNKRVTCPNCTNGWCSRCNGTGKI